MTRCWSTQSLFCALSPAELLLSKHNGMASDVLHPEVGLFVGTAVFLPVDADEVQCIWHDVLTGFREGHPGPVFPLTDGAGDDHRTWRRREDRRSEALMGANPGVDVGAVGAGPQGRGTEAITRKMASPMETSCPPQLRSTHGPVPVRARSVRARVPDNAPADSSLGSTLVPLTVGSGYSRRRTLADGGLGLRM